MSKIIPENISTISERLIKVLTDNGLVKKNGEVNFSAAERQCGMKGTVLQKAVKRNGGLYDDNLDKFLRTFQVKREWLLKGIGDIYNENPTPAINTGNKMEHEFTVTDAFRKIIEGGTEYVLVPRIAMQGSTLVSVDQLKRNESLIDWFISEHERLIIERDQHRSETEKLRLATPQKAK